MVVVARVPFAIVWPLMVGAENCYTAARARAYIAVGQTFESAAPQ